MQGEKLTYEFTKDAKLIEQYVNIRKTLYPVDEKFKGFRMFNYDGGENYNTDTSEMFIVHKNNVCVGGARLTMNEPGKNIPLPLEYDITAPEGKNLYSVIEAFPELHLETKKYAEFSRIVLLPQYRNRTYTKEIFYHMLLESKKRNIEYLFGIGDIIRSRLYKQIYASFGYKVKICMDASIFPREDYENVSMYLMTCDIGDKYPEYQPVTHKNTEEKETVTA